jgi:hypothetical protein
MKRTLQAFLVGTVMAFGGGSLVVAGDSADPVVGSWTLNVTKSKFNPGPAIKSQTRVYAHGADGTTLKVTGVAADGSQISQLSTFKTDGKDYPFSGAPNFDTISLKQVDAHTVHSTQKRKGKEVGTTNRTVSADGKVLTLASKGTDVKGVAYDDVMVFDRK